MTNPDGNTILAGRANATIMYPFTHFNDIQCSSCDVGLKGAIFYRSDAPLVKFDHNLTSLKSHLSFVMLRILFSRGFIYIQGYKVIMPSSRSSMNPVRRSEAKIREEMWGKLALGILEGTFEVTLSTEPEQSRSHDHLSLSPPQTFDQVEGPCIQYEQLPRRISAGLS